MMRKLHGLLALAVVMAALALAGCSNQASQTPTPDAKDVYTQVAQTVQAQITNNAKLTPQATGTPKPTETQAPTATLRPSSTLINLTNVAPSLTPQKTGGTVVLPPQATATAAGAATQPVATSADKLLYVSQSVADGTSFAQNEGFTISWILQNVGSTTWDSTYMVRLYAGERFNGADGSIGQTVKPNAQAKISIDMRAPNTRGEYTSVWVITNPEGRNFGSFTLTIKVK
jgi:outer membrane murein-binding lipoprotein Lpp